MKTPAVNIAAMFIRIQRTFEALNDIDRMLVTGGFQSFGGFHRSDAGAAQQ